MSRERLLKIFGQLVVPQLREMGFRGRRGHLIRRRDRVTEVIELQHSIYGGRVTANLGLDLEWLEPVVRWIPRPAGGPHAHDSIRWIRVGLTEAERNDRWWSFTDEDASIEEAVAGMGSAILSHGLPWLERERAQDAILEFAREKLERSRSPLHPEGTFPEQRLVAAVLAWSGRPEEAEVHAAHARQLWPEERRRLASARRVYQERSRRKKTKLPGVPNLLRELEGVLSE